MLFEREVPSFDRTKITGFARRCDKMHKENRTQASSKVDLKHLETERKASSHENVAFSGQQFPK
jgi:hypothetical protein